MTNWYNPVGTEIYLYLLVATGNQYAHILESGLTQVTQCSEQALVNTVHSVEGR